MTAGPAMHFCIAYNACEAAGTLARKFLLGRGIIHSATWAGKLLEGPNAVRHGSNHILPRSLAKCSIAAGRANVEKIVKHGLTALKKLGADAQDGCKGCDGRAGGRLQC